MFPTSLKTAIACIAACLAVLGASARQTGNTDTKKLVNPVKPTAESVALGKQLYQTHCALCHDSNRKGPRLAGTPPDLSDSKWDHGSSDGEIFDAIRNGIGPKFNMRPFRDKIQEQDTWHLVNYMRTLSAKDNKNK